MKSFLGWLKNSTKIKRWIFLMLVGMILACYGFAQVLVLERLEIFDIVKIIITFAAGLTAFIVGLIYIQKRTLELAVLKDSKSMDELSDSKDQGPKIVVIGGGIGLNRVLTGLKNYTNNLTAIVTLSNYGNKITRNVTDDIKNSIIALSRDSQEMAKLLYKKVDGINFGDLYLETMRKTHKDFSEGVERSNSVLSMIGKVLPATLDEMHICVELEDGTVIEEKEKIAEITTNKVTKINRVYINPTNCRTAPGIINAIKEADAIIIGPGSLYTSVIPNLLIKNVAKTIRESKAYKIYVSNIMTECGHTDDYSLSEHIKAITEHAGNNIIDYCITDNGDIIPEILRKYNKAGESLIEIDKQNIKGINVIKADVSCIEGEYIRHDPELLAKQIIELIVNDMSFKDKKNDEQYVLLNAKLKEAKTKPRKKKKLNIFKKDKNQIKSKSKFSSKYKDRIVSIRDSEETTKENKKIYEKAKELTDEEEKREKEKFLKDLKK